VAVDLPDGEILKNLLALNLERFGARCGQFTGELVAEDELLCEVGLVCEEDERTYAP